MGVRMWRLAVFVLASLLGDLVAGSDVASQAPLASFMPLLLTNRLVEFHKNLTEIESITYNEQAAGNWLYDSLKSQGYTVEKQYIKGKDGRFNILAYPGKTRDAKVLVSSHIDTVPPFYDYKYEKGLISGRGSVDDKASVAAQIFAVNALLWAGNIKDGDVALLFVVGEETGGDGMRRANDLKLKPKAVVFGEPTEGKLVAGHKGNSGLQITAKGKAGHSGYPWLGRSANEVLIKALNGLLQIAPSLPRSEKYGSTTMNIGRIEGGVASNVIPESAHANISFRLAAGKPELIEDRITKAIHSAVRSFLDGDMKPEDVIELKFSSTGYGPIDIDADVPGFEVITVNYGTDIPWLDYTVKGQKRYLYGPGSIMVAHSDHEALTAEELFTAVLDYQKIIWHALWNS